MRNALILMTALVPTSGHADLIHFASKLPETEVYVLLMGRSCEPVPLEQRTTAFSQHFTGKPNIHIIGKLNDLAPQNPEDSENFWEWWKNEIILTVPNIQWDYVVASEPYGKMLAEILNASFIPYDLGRQTNPVKSTSVRLNPFNLWQDILPTFRREWLYTATLFGQESVGKTTIGKKVSELLTVPILREWARPYQELMSHETTESVMAAIHLGQKALQETWREKAIAPVLLQDTDLFSTVGYWDIIKKPRPKTLLTDARKLKSSIYYMMPDDGPFVPDVLRFGGDKRESTMDFWVSILEEEKLSYVVVPTGSVDEKASFIAEDILARWKDRWEPIEIFQRT